MEAPSSRKIPSGSGDIVIQIAAFMPISASTVPVDGARARRVALASAVGTTVEWYDFFIYGTAAATVFGPRFFPQVSPVVGTLSAFATFGVGFLARPLGGVVMGHFGDRIGRKSMLVWSLLLMGLSTFGIGLLPDYSQIGVWAPTLLIVLRLVQGFALGGEWAGAVLMSVEHAPAGRRGFFGSIVGMGLPIGIVLSNLVFLIASVAADPAAFAAWGWRIPFLASAVLVAIGLFIRVRLDESPEFLRLQRSGGAARMPVVDLLRTNAGTVLLAAGTYTGESTSGYIVLVYYVSYATGVLKMPLSTVLGMLLGAASVFAAAVVVWARWSDQIGRPRVMLWGTGALVLWSMAFFPLLNTKSVPVISFALLVMLVIQGAYIGTQPAFFAELFPTPIRYSGASLSNTLGTILGGAPAPFVAAALFSATGTSRAVGAYITGMAVVSLVSVAILRRRRGDMRHPQ
jgi:metabolite-proton symporter